MTVEEKRDAIFEYCNTHPCDEKCGLFVLDPCEACWSEGADIERNYQMMTDSLNKARAANPYWERICKLSERQRAKGIETYGQGIESNPAAILTRIEYLQEEMIDALMYCEWIKDKLIELKGETHDQV